MKIPLCKPEVSDKMIEAASDAMRNERMVLGESVFKFEEEFADYIGTDFAVSVSSGTAALTLSMIALGGAGKEVVTTPLSFIATANSIIHAGGSPSFVDVTEDEKTLDLTRVEESVEEEQFLMPVHLFGHPCDMGRLMDLVSSKELVLIEDAAQAHGAEFDGQKVGSFGDTGCFSFYSTKNMTVGGDGGMVTTDNEELAEDIRKLRNCGRVSHYIHDVFGYTARLNTANAAFGRMQLKYLDEWNERRRNIASLYSDRLKHLEEVILPPPPSENKTPVFHLYAIRCERRDELCEYLEGRGIECGIHYPVPIHLQPVYRDEYNYQEGDYPTAEFLSKELLSIPIFPSLKSSEINYICEGIEDFYGGRE